MLGPIPVWLDCDPGHDDATAILLADVVPGAPKPLMRPPLLCPEIHGDSGLDGPGGGRLLPRSLRKPLTGRAVNVMYDAIAAAYYEGRRPGGSDGCVEGRGDGDASAAAAAAATVAVAPGAGRGHRVRLVCTGALTNAALLLSVYPEAAVMCEVVIMGGCLGVGNTGPVQEFNIQTDPEAAKIVFDSGVQLTMVPLEVTHTVLATPGVLTAIRSGAAHGAEAGGGEGGRGGDGDGGSQRADGDGGSGGDGGGYSATPAGIATAVGSLAIGPAAVAGASTASASAASDAASPFRHAVQQLLLFFADTYRRVFNFEDPPLHDPVAVAYVIAPQLFSVRRLRVDVETSSPLSAGQTVVDVWGNGRSCGTAAAPGAPPNADVALRVDVDGFWRLMLAAVERADAVSPLNRQPSTANNLAS
ncbi:hypothetical protein GPECTOR_16g600 [Gonium pectorale]|uniref:Inosine/uridine-preferring nucleoside hydrolase domain-containing protein n=1 Tax=Gonium pectorale TaxID=33097 RepID=A0A150GKP5_GONPE|nr:hypothetical protein GPECTOR_16g600 [Gonium pectorale]|eukprot:KXZ50426.1 hypothetical protein GPECTOR_16g600 [Gonium pectorale]